MHAVYEKRKTSLPTAGSTWYRGWQSSRSLWESWRGSWGLACSSSDAWAVSGRASRRWWWSAPASGGRTFARFHRHPQTRRCPSSCYVVQAACIAGKIGQVLRAIHTAGTRYIEKHTHKMQRNTSAVRSSKCRSVARQKDRFSERRSKRQTPPSAPTDAKMTFVLLAGAARIGTKRGKIRKH